MKKNICTAVAIGCAILILCVAGASDHDRMSTLEASMIAIPALIAIAVSMKIGGFFE